MINGHCKLICLQPKSSSLSSPQNCPPRSSPALIVEVHSFSYSGQNFVVTLSPLPHAPHAISRNFPPKYRWWPSLITATGPTVFTDHIHLSLGLLQHPNRSSSPVLTQQPEWKQNNNMSDCSIPLLQSKTQSLTVKNPVPQCPTLPVQLSSPLPLRPHHPQFLPSLTESQPHWPTHRGSNHLLTHAQPYPDLAPCISLVWKTFPKDCLWITCSSLPWKAPSQAPRKLNSTNFLKPTFPLFFHWAPSEMMWYLLFVLIAFPAPLHGNLSFWGHWYFVCIVSWCAPGKLKTMLGT